jgi:phage terminase large subunit GpA-like protein
MNTNDANNPMNSGTGAGANYGTSNTGTGLGNSNTTSNESTSYNAGTEHMRFYFYVPHVDDLAYHAHQLDRFYTPRRRLHRH